MPSTTEKPNHSVLDAIEHAGHGKLDLQALGDFRRKQEDEFARSAREELRLRRLGKKPVLKRSFGFMSVLGFSCTVLITWEGALILCTSALLNGGTAGVIWSFLINWIGIFSTFVTIAELASMAPVSGGQFHWISLLAPPSSQKFLSYITGWVTVIGWQALTLSSAYLGAGVITGTVGLVHTTFHPTRWQVMLITWAVLAYAILFNTISSRVLARFEGVILIVHVLGFFGVLIPLVYFGPHGNSSVFTTFFDGGGWNSDGLSFLVGVPTLVYSLFGADCAVHMSEEIQSASRAVPQALQLSIGINGGLGFAMLIATMFRLGNLDDALMARSGFAYLEIFKQAVGSAGGAAAMSSVVTALGLCGTVGTFAAATRLLWAFARENGVPFAHIVAKVDHRSVLPINAVLVTLLVSVLLLLISLGSPVALEDLIDLSIASIFASYLFVCLALLVRRLQGKVKEYDTGVEIRGPDSLHWGPWRVPEPFGTINNIFNVIFLTWTLFWTFWPETPDPSLADMNWNVVVFSGTVLSGVAWYFAVGHKSYSGPIVEFSD